MAIRYIFRCKYCGMEIESDRTPSMSGCPARSSHYWLRTRIN